MSRACCGTQCRPMTTVQNRRQQQVPSGMHTARQRAHHCRAVLCCLSCKLRTLLRHICALQCQRTPLRATATLCHFVQGVSTCIGGYDLVSGVRQGRVDVKSPPVALMFSRDGSLLVVATAVRRGRRRGRDWSAQEAAPTMVAGLLASCRQGCSTQGQG